jgi:Ran GTPase-activating protein (RanGAP) involved in mRNA processing and transport
VNHLRDLRPGESVAVWPLVNDSKGTAEEFAVGPVETIASAGRLTSLTLYHCGLTAAAVEALAKAACLTSLTSLILEGNPIGDEGARALAELPHLKNLGMLDLSRCEIQLAGARALADSPYLPDHLALDVGVNRFGKEGDRVLGRFAPPGPKKKR